MTKSNILDPIALKTEFFGRSQCNRVKEIRFLELFCPCENDLEGFLCSEI